MIALWAIGPSRARLRLGWTRDVENTRRVLASANLKAFHDDLSLANIMLRPAGSETFRSLRNMRGDGYAIVLNAFGKTDLAGLVNAADAQKRIVMDAPMLLARKLGACRPAHSVALDGSRRRSY
jgi:hypothetical protein